MHILIINLESLSDDKKQTLIDNAKALGAAMTQVNSDDAAITLAFDSVVKKVKLIRRGKMMADGRQLPVCALESDSTPDEVMEHLKAQNSESMIVAMGAVLHYWHSERGVFYPIVASQPQL